MGEVEDEEGDNGKLTPSLWAKYFNNDDEPLYAPHPLLLLLRSVCWATKHKTQNYKYFGGCLRAPYLAYFKYLRSSAGNANRR